MNRNRARRARSFSRALLITAALLLTAAARRPAAPAQDGAASRQSPATTREAPRRRTLHVTVTDGQGRFAGGLGREAFAVYDRGAPLSIVSVGEPDAPVSVGIVVDASGSMRQTLRGKGSKGESAVRAAVSEFLGRGNAGNEYFVIGFNESPQLILDRTREHAPVLSALDALSARKPRGESALYDACRLALDKVSYGAHPKRALLVISDGLDNASRYKFKELRRALMEQDVTVYALGVVDMFSDYSALNPAGRAILDELADVSGGLALFPSDDKEVRLAAGRIAVELRWQYPVGVEFAPSARKDGWHELEVKVAASADPVTKKSVKLHARTRRGFYEAPASR